MKIPLLATIESTIEATGDVEATEDLNLSSADVSTDHIPAPTPESIINLELESPSALSEELAGLKLSHTKQKGDCLYCLLYTSDAADE